MLLYRRQTELLNNRLLKKLQIVLVTTNPRLIDYIIAKRSLLSCAGLAYVLKNTLPYKGREFVVLLLGSKLHRSGLIGNERVNELTMNKAASDLPRNPIYGWESSRLRLRAIAVRMV